MRYEKYQNDGHARFRLNCLTNVSKTRVGFNVRQQGFCFVTDLSEIFRIFFGVALQLVDEVGGGAKIAGVLEGF